MKYVPKGLTRAFGSGMLKLKASSPTLLVVGGVIGMASAAVMAAKATRHVDDIFDDHAQARMELDEREEAHPSDQKTHSRDVASIYTTTAIRLTKTYGPAIFVGTTSAIAILGGHNILRHRQIATMAAYSGLLGEFRNYRQRVADTFGEGAERELHNGARGVMAEDEDRKGEYKRVSEYSDVKDDSYLRPFMCSDTSGAWTSSPKNNYLWMRTAQKYMNDRLETRGYLFLNDVRKDLGLEPVPEGQVLGWVFDPLNPDAGVDLGFMNLNNPHHVSFAEGEINNIQLNINVQGVIYDKMRDYLTNNH